MHSKSTIRNKMHFANCRYHAQNKCRITNTALLA